MWPLVSFHNGCEQPDGECGKEQCEGPLQGLAVLPLRAAIARASWNAIPEARYSCALTDCALKDKLAAPGSIKWQSRIA